MRVPTAVVAAGGALLAVAATGIPLVVHGREPDVLNLAAGLVLLVAGAQLRVLNQTRVTGTLLVLASAAWFVPDLAPEVLVVGRLLAAASLVHVVPLVAAVLAAPQGRLVGRMDRAMVLLAVVAAGSAVTGGYQLLVPTVGVALLVAAWPASHLVRRLTTRATWVYRLAVLALATALTGIPVLRATIGRGHESYLFAAYSGLVALTAICLVQVGPWLRRFAVLDVGPDALAAMDDLLAEVTGDPGAHALVRLTGDRWVRLDGTPGLPPTDASGPVVVATVRSVPPALKATVAAGLRLAGQNVVARVLLDERARELAAVRTRLVSVEEDERVALVARLRSGPLAALVDVRESLTAHGSPPHLIEHVRDTERDIERVASGLDPLDQFASAVDAIRTLAEQLGATFEVAKDNAARELPSSLTDVAWRALWYACSEALTNAAKHAPESRRCVRLARQGARVVLVVSDDGPGPGAARGSGLLGVRDRVAAVGGTVAVTDGHPGTRVEVAVPTTRQHLGRPGVTSDARDTISLLAWKPPTTEARP